MKREHIESMFNALGDLVATIWEEYGEQNEEKPEPVIKPMCELEYARLNFFIGGTVILENGANKYFFEIIGEPYLHNDFGAMIETSGGDFKCSDLNPISDLSYTMARPKYGL